MKQGEKTQEAHTYVLEPKNRRGKVFGFLRKKESKKKRKKQPTKKEVFPVTQRRGKKREDRDNTVKKPRCKNCKKNSAKRGRPASVGTPKINGCGNVP